MIREALQYVVEGYKGVEKFAFRGLDGNDHDFTSEALFEVKPEPPKLPAKVHVSSLQGLATLVRERIDGVDPKDVVIQVVDHAKVSLYDKATDQYGRRLVLIEAEPVNFDKFQFGQWIAQEEFIIGVASRFSQTDDKDYVLKIASALTNEATNISEDNGFSQKATIKAGMRVPETVVLKGQVQLAPYRTFPEVGQPISSFVFRARGGEKPLLMLVEADGGKWKLDAMNEVRRYLSTLELGIEIVA